ncbi:MAG TPA: hypothetical protein VG759_20835, partial [Candidatus Angelobacter sp.]|nr:hypothetical protein [Candidatus Angelobacter sp.]
FVREQRMLNWQTDSRPFVWSILKVFGDAIIFGFTSSETRWTTSRANTGNCIQAISIVNNFVLMPKI